MHGVSYDGWLTVMALNEPHPALKAASPQASPADMFLGDDFHHNGAFRLSYGFEYAAMMEAGKDVQQFKFDQRDTFEWFLDLGPLSNANARYLQGKIPTWNDFAGHPNYDSFWRKQAVNLFLTRPKVPTLNVAGWWDQEDFYGPLKIYETWEKNDSSRLNTVVVGPWNHGGWSRGIGDRLGPIKFDKPTAWQFREKIEVPFFAHYLKDRPLVLDKELGRSIPARNNGQRSRGSARGDQLSHRRQRVEVVRPLAARRRHGSQALSCAKEVAWLSNPRQRHGDGGRPVFDEFISTRRVPCPIISGRSRRSTSIRNGPSGWSRTSGSSIFALMWSVMKPSRSCKTST